MQNWYKNIFLYTIIILLVPFTGICQQHKVDTISFENQHIVEAENSGEIHNDSQKKFDPNRFIFGHIEDAHEWHIFTWKGHHVSIPLPVILYSKNSGFHFFMSTKLAHGHHYKGFYYGIREDENKIFEKIAEGQIIKPLDFSITKNVVAIFCSLIIMLLIFFSVAKTYKRNPYKAPRGLQNLIEPVILFIRDDVAKPSIGEKNHERFLPFLLTVFFFILINNLMGLIPIVPGGANVTGNIAVTLVLAVFTFLMTAFNGNKNYWLHIFNSPVVPWWLKFPIPLVPIIEIVGMFIKPFVLMVRLFANISAGHIIALGFFSLIFIFGEISQIVGYGVSILSVTFSVFMSFLELLVAFIQAYVFTLLSALYFGMAVEEHH
ncbi:MAG: F0F1 ATP synthase subunit A [Bacteroidales bacterium]|nr:F0F1 ATP synthase subunit A [Bacteroidales bacterium]